MRPCRLPAGSHFGETGKDACAPRELWDVEPVFSQQRSSAISNPEPIDVSGSLRQRLRATYLSIKRLARQNPLVERISCSAQQLASLRVEDSQLDDAD